MTRHKKTGFATLLKGGAALIVVGGIAVGVLLQSLDVNHYRDMVAGQVQQATGRRLSLEGDVHLSLGLSPSIVVERAAFANAPWGSRPDMIRVEKLEVEIALLPALFGEIHIDRLILVKPDIVLETNAGGVGNWVLNSSPRKAASRGSLIAAAFAAPSEPASDTAAEPATEALEKPILPVVASVRIQDAHVLWKDGQRRVERTLSIHEMMLSADSPDAPATLDLAGVAEGVPFDLSGGLGPMADLVQHAKNQASDPWPFSIQGDVADMTVEVNGSVEQLLALNGLETQFSIMAPTVDGLRSILPSIPQFPPFSVAGQVTSRDGVWALADGSLTFGPQKAAVTGHVDLQGKRPRIEAQMTAPMLNLGAFTAVGAMAASDTTSEKASDNQMTEVPAGSTVKTSASAVSGKLFSTQKLALSGMRSVDAVVDIQADKVILAKDLAMTDVTLKINAVAGRAQLDPLHAHLLGQPVTMTGTFDVPASGRVAITLNGETQDVPFGDVLARLGTRDVVAGAPTDMTFSLKTAGQSVADFMSRLNGRIRVEMREGEIKSALLESLGRGPLGDISGLFKAVLGKKSAARLSCGVVNVPIKAGVATWNRHIAFETSEGAVVSSGRVDFGNETLDVGLRPLTRDGVGSLAGLFRVTGSLAHPTFGLSEKEVARDMISLLGVLATGGTKALKQSLEKSNTAPGSVCAAARLDALPHSAPSQKTPSTTPQSQPSVDALKALEKGLKGLFQ